jgi:YceI-like domain
VDSAGDRLSVNGDLELAGETRPVSFELDVSPGGAVGATIRLSQSEWGIKPYSALMGSAARSPLGLARHLSVVRFIPAGRGQAWVIAARAASPYQKEQL